MEGPCSCLEVVHTSWTGYRFNLEQNTADNASAGQVVIGPRLPVPVLTALDTVAVRLHDGNHLTLGQGVGGWRGCFLLGMLGRLRQLFYDLDAPHERLGQLRIKPPCEWLN